VPRGKPCFASQVKRCKGVCTGHEAPAEHDARLRAALAPLRLVAWPHAGPVGLTEGSSVHVIDRWSYLGTAGRPDDLPGLLARGRGQFERATYQLLLPQLAALRAAPLLQPPAPPSPPPTARKKREPAEIRAGADMAAAPAR